MRSRSHFWIYAAVAIAALILFRHPAQAEDTLLWSTNQDRVTANIQSLPVLNVLEAIALHTGWQVFIEPNTGHVVSTKFQNLSRGRALRMLLGDLNFAIVPQTNGPNHLYVFRTEMGNARQRIRPSTLNARKRSGIIPNQLIVMLKPGAKIDSMGCLGAGHVTGHIDSLNAYQVEFQDAAAANSARQCFTNDPNVLSVENNYSLPQPELPQGVAGSSPSFNLDPKSPNNNCQVVVALIDTHVQDLGKTFDQFLKPAIAVAGSSQDSSQLTHGTGMAETILYGMSANSSTGQTGARVLPIDVYGPNETTSTFAVGQGINAAITNGANIINLSLGGGDSSPFLQTLIQNSEQQGVVFFAAAGNEPVTTPFYPAAYPGVQAVTASSAPGQIAPYADRGSFVDLMLPGTSVVPFQGQSWDVTGTSTATAYASGIAAGLADSMQNCPGEVVPTIQSKFGVNFSGNQ